MLRRSRHKSAPYLTQIHAMRQASALKRRIWHAFAPYLTRFCAVSDTKCAVSDTKRAHTLSPIPPRCAPTTARALARACWALAWARLGALQRSTCSVTIIIVAHCFRSVYVATARVERPGRPIATPKQPTPCRNAFGAMAGFLASLRVIGGRGRRDVPAAARWWSAVKWVRQAATMPTAETLAGNVTPRGAASSPSEKPVQPIDLAGPYYGGAIGGCSPSDVKLVNAHYRS